MPDAIHHPSHYTRGKIEAWDYITDQFGLAYLLGNVVKYITRAGHKEGNSALQDLRKAQAYIERAIREEEGRSHG